MLSSENSSPYIMSVGIEKIKSEVMLHFLEEREIYVSSGSACSKGKKSNPYQHIENLVLKIKKL